MTTADTFAAGRDGRMVRDRSRETRRWLGLGGRAGLVGAAGRAGLVGVAGRAGLVGAAGRAGLVTLGPETVLMAAGVGLVLFSVFPEAPSAAAKPRRVVVLLKSREVVLL